MINPKPKSLLSLDLGKKRIGLAGCDALGITITRLPALHRKNFDNDLTILRNHCEKRNVKGLIIGIPLDENGQETEQSKYCRKDGIKFARALRLPLAWVNEHSSSWEAARRFNLHADKSGTLDSAAAALLLEQWLEEGPECIAINSPSYKKTSKDDYDGKK